MAAMSSSDRAPDDRPTLSVVVPTYREAGNLAQLIDRLFAATRAAGVHAELLIVDDDSQDGSEQIVAGMAARYPVRILVRAGRRGLSSAVVDGFDRARGRFLLCMDADLSHPPEKVPVLVERLASGQHDFAIGSRYVGGGRISADWPVWRRINSWLATAPARLLVPVRDPLSGFFCLSRDTYQRARGRIRPIGYKIGLELMVKCRCRRIAEEPIVFEERQAGRSKLAGRQRLEYAWHLLRLYLSRFPGYCLIAAVLAGAVLMLVWRMIGPGPYAGR